MLRIQPTPGAGSPPLLTRLVPVRRDGNPLRDVGLVSPFAGKIAPLDGEVLLEAGAAMACLVREGDEPIWVVGLTESSLIAAWFLVPFLPPSTVLALSTRERPAHGDVRTFEEPHSHGRHHALVVPPDAGRRRLVVVEDELTTGATLLNLLTAVRDVARSATVILLSDQRSPEARAWFEGQAARLGVHVAIRTLSATAGRLPAWGYTSAADRALHELARAEGRRMPGLLAALGREWTRDPPDAAFAVGECVDVPLVLWSVAAPTRRPVFRHVTRSPWRVDGETLRRRLTLGGGRDEPRHFLYNQPPPAPGQRAWIFSHPSAAHAADDLADWWTHRGGQARRVRVPAP